MIKVPSKSIAAIAAVWVGVSLAQGFDPTKVDVPSSPPAQLVMPDASQSDSLPPQPLSSAGDQVASSPASTFDDAVAADLASPGTAAPAPQRSQPILQRPDLPAPYQWPDKSPAITGQYAAPTFPQPHTPFATESPDDVVAGAYVPPEQTVTEAISQRDTNRVHCPVDVTDVFYSKEKPVSISVDGADVYVKLHVKVIGGTIQKFVTEPVDLHVVCGGAVYTMILDPQPIDSVTLRLGNPIEAKLKAIVREWGALPIEEKVQRLTRMVYRDELPEGFHKFAMSPDRRNPRLFRNVIIQGVSRVSAPGLGLAALEYQVIAQEPLRLDERDFLNIGLSKEIVSVTVDPLILNEKGRSARLIIIERSISDGR